MRMSCLITTLNPMTEITNPARLIQSPTLIFIGSSALIIERGRATFTLFLCDTTLCAGRDPGVIFVPGRCPCRRPSHNLPSARRTVQPDAKRTGRPQLRRTAASAAPFLNGISDGNQAVVRALAQSQTVRYSRTSDLSWASATPESLAVPGPVSHNWTFGMSHIDLAIGPTDATESAIWFSGSRRGRSVPLSAFAASASP